MRDDFDARARVRAVDWLSLNSVSVSNVQRLPTLSGNCSSRRSDSRRVGDSTGLRSGDSCSGSPFSVAAMPCGDTAGTTQWRFGAVDGVP